MSARQQHPDGGTIFPTGSSPRDAKAGSNIPEITLAVEHYNRMIRVLDKNIPVKVELNLETKYHRRDDAERLQHDCGDSRQRPRVRSRYSGRAFRFASVRDRSDR